MSFGGGYQGGRTRMGTKIFLNVYDLSPYNDVLLFPLGLGLHHTGVEIMGTEYSFASGSGIFTTNPPKQVPNAKFRFQLEMGVVDGGSVEINKAIDDLRDVFTTTNYHLIYRNCNHFSNALVYRLLQKPIPAYINRLADVGNCCSCLLPKALLEEAPVGHVGNGGNGGSSSSSSPFAPRSNNMQRNPNIMGNNKAFSGTGNRLGSSDNDTSSLTTTAAGTNTTTTTSSSGGFMSRWMDTTSKQTTKEDDLTDRRERARKAALARLERNQQDSVANVDKQN